MKTNALKTLVAIMAMFIASNAFAEEYNYSQPGFSQNGITVEYMDFRYNSDTETFTAEVATNDSKGSLAKGFYFGTTEGNMPTSNSEMALVYFDGTNLNDPKVSVYTYNLQATLATTSSNYCANDPGSWWYGATKQKYNVPDRIISSADPRVSPLQFTIRSATSTTTAGVTRVVYKLSLNTRMINTHNPLYRVSTTNWKGLKFGPKLGLWGWVVSGVQSSYFVTGDAQPDRERFIFGPSCPVAVGYLKSFSITGCALADETNKTTNLSPKCGAVTVTPAKPEVGNKVSISIKSTDTENDPLKVSYQGLANGMTPNVANGGIVTPSNGTAEVKLDWTPTTSGATSINVSFEQQYGYSKAFVNCPVDVTIYKSNPPTCTPEDNTVEQLALDSASTSLAIVASVVGKANTSLVGQKPAIDDLVTKSEDLHLKAWTSVWTLIPQKAFTCTPYIESRCTTTNYQSALNSATADVSSINKNITSLLKSLNASIKKQCRKVKGAKAKACKRARRTATQATKDSKAYLDQFNTAATTIKTTSQQCI